MDRLQKIRDILQKEKLDGIFISTPSNITYLTGFDFLSPGEREAFLLVTKKHQYIISSFLYKDEFIHMAPDFTFLDISANGGTPFWKYLERCASNEKISSLGFESHNLTVEEHIALKKINIKLHPLSIDEIRDKKDEKQLSSIAKACKIGDTAFSKILEKIKPGMTEKEIGCMLDTEIRQQGAEPSFATIIAFGENAAVPHHKSNETKLKSHDVILLDFGARIHTYCSDMTRTIFLKKPTEREKDIYKIVQISQEKALEYLFVNPLPIRAESVDAIARNYILKKGFPSIPHSLGHSIGIAVHDGFRLSPLSRTQLVNGMAFSVEPGIYLPGEIGIRIEDIVALTENGPKILTKSSRELIIL